MMSRILKLIVGLAPFAFLLTQSPQAFAQLATRHYLPPIPAYSNASIELQISTPSASPVSYTISSGNATGGLTSGGMSLDAIEGTVTAGSPDVVTFTRSGNNSDASGGLGRTTMAASTVEQDFGILVEASAAVTVIMSSLQSNNRSIVAGKGDNGVGTDFYAWSAFNTTDSKDTSIGANNQNSHFISILSLVDGNQITVDGADIFENFDPATDNPLTLDAFETITLGTASSTTLTGTHISSTGNITVTSGDVHPYQPNESQPVYEQDGGVDQLIPNRLAGTHYVVGSLEDHHAYGSTGAGTIQVGNRYVQIIGLSDDTTVRHYQSAGDSFIDYTDIDEGEVLAIALPGLAGAGHFFTSVGSGTEPFLLFLNSSAEPGDEMGGAAIPALRGKSSDGTFCSGTSFVEFAAPADVTGFMVYVPSDQVDTLQVDTGAGFADYDTYAVTSETDIDPDGAGGVDEIRLVIFPGSLVSEGARIAFSGSGRIHVAVGTADPNLSGSFGYFSDYNYGFAVVDPELALPTDAYVEPLTFADATPRAVTHCIDVNSACSRLYSISAISSDRGGSFDNVTETATVNDADPCFDFTPVPVPGAGPQEYVVTAQIDDETGGQRSVDIFFTFTWLDDEGDGIPDSLDLDDDNDGVPDASELGGVDLSGDSDLDNVPDYIDVDYVSCESANSISCDAIPEAMDRDGDGVPNHQDLDSDGDGVWDLIEGNDEDQDGANDNLNVADAGNDGVIDAVTDTNDNGLDDSYETALGGEPAAQQNSDSDALPDYLDDDDDGDGILTIFEDYNGGNATDDDTDSDDLPDYLDDDDDDDGLATDQESPDPNNDGDPEDAIDSDDSAPPDYLDASTLGPTNTDGDGQPDFLDEDDDNDGVPDSLEGSVDSDLDGIIDSLDLDSDNDGIPDLYENGLGVLDADGDGRIDDATDDDGDGIPNVSEGISIDANTDMDLYPDRIDLDSDGDGIPDVSEAGATDANGDGVLDSTDDGDDDGLLDEVDIDDGGSLPPLPNTDGSGNPDFQDLDSDDDGVDDAVEGHDHDFNGVADISADGNDGDGDGLDDAFDPDAGATPAPTPDRDDDDTPDYQDTDDDGDGILTTYEDVNDNGAPGDDDSDDDDIPDYLDPDDDGDGVPTQDEEPDPNGDGNPDDAAATLSGEVPDYLNPDQTPPDTDGDGVADAIECPAGSPQPDTDDDGTPDCEDSDDDGDGVPTQDETANGDSDDDGTDDYLDSDDDGDGVLTRFEDPDGDDDPKNDDSDDDGVPNYLDPDDDGDGVLTINEGADPDGNGDPSDAIATVSNQIPDYLNPELASVDSDGDGIPDAVECPSDSAPPDTDGDGTIDCEDDDDDGDGVPTDVERELGDSDGDGIPDYLDADSGVIQSDVASLKGGGFGCTVGPRGAQGSGIWILLLAGLPLLRRRIRREVARPE